MKKLLLLLPLIFLLTACGSGKEVTQTSPANTPSATSQINPTTSPTTRPIQATTPHSYQPYQNSQLILPSSATVSGDCFASSINLPNNATAFRCIEPSGTLYDPCITSSPNSTTLACATTPLAPVVLFKATSLPAHQALTTGAPWFITLANHDQCSFVTGASDLTIENQHQDYHCTSGATTSSVDTSSVSYTVKYALPNATSATLMTVTDSWS